MTRPLLFVHVRKNAGTSIKQWFSENECPLLVADEFPHRDIQSYPSFGVCRNPYDRAISGWLYCESTRHRPLMAALLDPPQETDIQPGLTPGHDYRHFTKLQSDFLYSADRCFRVKHIVKYETLERDVRKLAAAHGFNLKTPMPKVNKTQHRNGFSNSFSPLLLTDQEKDLIYQVYHEDFQLLGYPR